MALGGPHTQTPPFGFSIIQARLPLDMLHSEASPATSTPMLRDSAQNYSFENIYIKNKSEHLVTS